MKNRNKPTAKIALCALLFLNLCTTRAASPPAERPIMDAVVLTGLLHVDDNTNQDAVLRVEVNGVTQIAPVSETGRFELMLPAEADVVLHFELPGHLPKDVTVDTHHARDGDFRQRKRHLEFAVIMEPELPLRGLMYAGPVGAIGFDPGGGCVAISHNKKLVPAKHDAVMVF